MRWGFRFGKTSDFGTINIRSESVKEKPFYKHFLLNKRCLIVADSFYEWNKVNLEGKEEKFPYNFFLKGRKLFGMAGLYNDFPDAEGRPIYTCAILTTEPNKVVKPIHHRMPVILNVKDEETWLDSENKEFNKLLLLLRPYHGAMERNMVSRRVNSPRNDDKELIEKYEQEKDFKLSRQL